MSRIVLISALFIGALALSAQTPVVADGGVLNGASFAKGQSVAPGSLVTIFGSQLAAAVATADTIPLSNSLGNVTVTFNNISAPLLFVNPTQINAQLPSGVLPGGGPGVVNVVVTNNGVVSVPVAVNVTPISAAIFGAVANGKTLAIAVNNADSSLAWPQGSVAGAHPATAGDALIIYGTGFGPVDQPVDDGGIPTTLTNTVNVPKVTVGGIQAQLLFSGLAPQFVGVNQFNIVIPAGVPTGDAVPLQVQIGGVTTSADVVIAIK